MLFSNIIITICRGGKGLGRAGEEAVALAVEGEGGRGLEAELNFTIKPSYQCFRWWGKMRLVTSIPGSKCTRVTSVGVAEMSALESAP